MRPQAGRDFAVMVEKASRESLEELVWVRFTVGPRELEDALEALASASFAINPSLVHSPHDATTAVEFPLYRDQVEEVERRLADAGLTPAISPLGWRQILEEISS